MSIAADHQPARRIVRKPPPTLVRETFKTSRLMEFCSRKELINQTGHDADDWPLVLGKELIDNALDACEEAVIPPSITIETSTERREIVVSDNGPGIPAETVSAVCDYTVRVSSREAYVSPTRGAQGNALKTIVAMSFALDGSRGETVIEARGIAHRIAFSVNQLLQEPRLVHETAPSNVTIGTRITIRWPDSACSILEDAKRRFLQIADDFAWINPHLRIRVRWDDEICVDRLPSNPGWQKWRACDATSPHWYDEARFERYIAAHVSRDHDLGRERTVREFVEELRGFSGSAKQKAVLADIGMPRLSLSSLFDADGSPDRDSIARLLLACQKHSRPVKPKLLGLIGRDHLLACFHVAGVHEASFKYEKAAGEHQGMPWAIETAFGYCPMGGIDRRRIIAGVNFSVGIGNPFRSFRRYGGEGLEALLTQLRAAADEPIVYIIHYTHPRVEYTDRGKTALTIPGSRPVWAE